MKKSIEIKLQIILSILIMVLAIYLGTTLGNKAKIDFTQEKLYSLSEGSIASLKKLKNPVKLKLYYSKQASLKGSEALRAFNNYFYYVRDFLQEYVAQSQNNLSLEVIDPRPDTPDEEEAEAYGLKRFALSESEKYFFGLVAISENGPEKVIDFFDPEKQGSLEYDITKLIYSTTEPTKKVVGILSTEDILQEGMSPYMMQMLSMQGKSFQSPWIIVEQMKELFTVKSIAVSPDQFSNISSITGVDILLVVHPQNFPTNLNYAIDQFVLSGGKLVVLVDPHSISIKGAQASPMAQSLSASTLGPLFDHWGVQFNSQELLGDRALSGMGRVNEYSAPTRLIPVLNCDKRCLNKNGDIISSGLNNLTFFFPGALSFDSKKSNLTFSSLIQTTDKGNTYKIAPFEVNQPEMINQKFQDGSSEKIIALKAYGKLNSLFSAPPAEVLALNPKAQETFIKEGTKEAAMVIVADVDFIYDQFAYRKNMLGLTPVNDNAAFLLNSLENLAGPSDLLAVRSKGKYLRQFDLIDTIELEAEKATFSKVQEINQSIEMFTQELNLLGKRAEQGQGESIALLKNETLSKKKELNKKIIEKKRQLREVKRSGREKIEKIGLMLQYFNTLFVPLILLAISLRRYQKTHKKLLA